MAILRDLYLKQIEIVKAAGDPKGVIRDKKKNQLIVISGRYRWISTDERREMEQTIA